MPAPAGRGPVRAPAWPPLRVPGHRPVCHRPRERAGPPLCGGRAAGRADAESERGPAGGGAADTCRMSFKVSGAARAGRAGSGRLLRPLLGRFPHFPPGSREPRGEPGTVAIVTGRGWGEAGGGQGFPAASPGRQALRVPPAPAASSEHFICEAEVLWIIRLLRPKDSCFLKRVHSLKLFHLIPTLEGGLDSIH